MAKYQIFTDSSSDLTPELRKQYGISYFYFGLVVDGKEYRADLDWKDYTPEEFYGWLKEGKKERAILKTLVFVCKSFVSFTYFLWILLVFCKICKMLIVLNKEFLKLPQIIPSTRQ